MGTRLRTGRGVVVTVLATKHLYERNSAESGLLPKSILKPALEFLRDYSLGIFLLVTGIGWVTL
jgi:hypothetical protein